MKPKYRRIARSLPLMITIAVSAPCVSNADIFNDDSAGNARPNAALNNGDTTVVADNTLNGPSPVVTIDAGVDLNGDDGLGRTGVVELSGIIRYTVDVANGGSLTADNDDLDGINSSTVGFTLENDGTISGFGLGQGIDAPGTGLGGETVINNGATGFISGPNDAIRFRNNGGVVNNLGTIDGSLGGLAEAGSDGIQGIDDVTVDNDGSITGLDNGIDLNNGAIIGNNGSITGGTDGIAVVGTSLLDGAVINNNTNFSSVFPFNPVSGGSISGGDSGIAAGDFLTVNNNLLAEITGINDAGIFAGDSATINNSGTFDTFSGTFIGGTITSTNDAGIDVGEDAVINNFGAVDTVSGLFIGGTISGGTYGIVADDGLLLTNNGTITGELDDAVETGANSTIINSGTIRSNGSDGIEINGTGSTVTNSGSIISTASDGIQVFAGALDTFVLNNTGLIQGAVFGNAFLGDDSDEELNLGFGSRIDGDIDGNGGIDTINFDGGLTQFGFSAFGDTPDGKFSNSILGDVFGIDTINKTGSGVAFIGVPGDGGYEVEADFINITDGGLYINADISPNTLLRSTINAGGTALGGTGTWDADINVTAGGFSAGAIPINLDSNPTNSIGTVTVNGDVSHAFDTFIRYDVQPGAFGQAGILGSGVTTPFLNPSTVLVSGGTAADLIVQNGIYDMGGGYVRIAATNGDAAISDGTYVIVQSDQNIQGSVQLRPNVQFNSNVTDSGPFVGTESGSNNSTTVLGSQFSTVTIAGNQLLLNVNHDFSSLALDANAAAFGNALDASINSSSAITQDFIAALDFSDLDTVQATLSAASPTSSFANTLAIISGNYRLHRLVQDHLAFTRSGGDTVSMNVGSYSEPAPAPEPMVRNSGMGNVWGTVSYAWKDIDSNGRGDFDGEEASFTAGIDYRVAPNFLVGILLDGSTADYDFTGGSSDVESFRAAIYGTYGAPTGIYADFLVGYGTHDSDLRRNAGLLGTLNGSPDADSFQAMLTVGYAMQSGCVKHGPFAGVEYQNIDVDGYNQGGLLPIAVDGYDVDSLRLLAGYRAEADYGKFNPYLSVAYAHELEDDAISTTATLPGGAGFGVTGSGLESAILISLGTNYAINESLSLNAGYHGEISVGDDGTDSHGASLGLNYAF